MNKIMIKIKFCVLIFCYAYFFAHSNCSAQRTKSNHETRIQRIKGNWFDKKNKRHLSIHHERGQEYFTINDWYDIGKGKEPMIDAYKAWPRGNKLIMLQSTTDLRAPYAEILPSGKFLLYRTKKMNDENGPFIDSAFFSRYK